MDADSTKDELLKRVHDAAYQLGLHLPIRQGDLNQLRQAQEDALAGERPLMTLIDVQQEGYIAGVAERERQRESLQEQSPPLAEDRPLTDEQRALLGDLLTRLTAQTEKMQRSKRRTARNIGELESLILELESATDEIFGPDQYAYENVLRHIEQFGEYLDDRSEEMREQRQSDWESAIHETETWIVARLQSDLAAAAPESQPPHQP